MNKTDSIVLLGSQKHSAMLTEGGGALPSRSCTGGTGPAIYSGQKNIKPAYAPDDTFWQYLRQLIWCDKDARQIMEKDAAAIYGRGLFCFTEDMDGKKTAASIPAVNAFKGRFALGWPSFFRSLILNFRIYGNAFFEVILNRRGQIYSFQSIDCHYVRAEALDGRTGRVMNYYLFERDSKTAGAVLGTAANSYLKIDKVPAFDPADPRRHSKFIYHLKMEEPGFTYYPPPLWFGSWKSMQLRQKITEYHLSALQNGWNVKYHIQINGPVFYQGCTTKEDKLAKKAALLKKLDGLLAGTENTGKSLVTEFDVDHLGKMIEGVKITPIANNLGDSAYTELIKLTTESSPMNYGMDPELAGVVTGSNLSSGSEVANKYNLHQVLNTPLPRATVLEVMHIFQMIERWQMAGAQFGFKDVILTTRDTNGSGFQQNIN